MLTCFGFWQIIFSLIFLFFFAIFFPYAWLSNRNYTSITYLIFCFVFFSADIVFIVKDKPHPIFKRDDDNLVYTATVPLGKVNKDHELKQLLC